MLIGLGFMGQFLLPLLVEVVLMGVKGLSICWEQHMASVW
jgi:hypothetical protein